MTLTLPRSFYDDILSQFPDADPSAISAKVTASGDETASASVKLSVNADDSAITSSATTVVEADGKQVATTARADASGETGSTLIDLQTGIEEQNGQIETTSSASAEAEAEGDVATATAITDAQATGSNSVAVTQTPSDGEATENGWEVTQTGENPTATSTTELTAFWIDDVEVDALQLTLAEEQTNTWWKDVDWSS